MYVCREVIFNFSIRFQSTLICMHIAYCIYMYIVYYTHGINAKKDSSGVYLKCFIVSNIKTLLQMDDI